MSSNTSAPSIDPVDENHPDNVPLKHEGWTSIQDKKRRCTDIIFLLLLICSWLAMTIVGFAAVGIYPSASLRQGNIDRLTHSSDYDGRICGIDSEVSSRKYGYYLLDGSSVCVSSCPTSTNYNAVICRDEYQAAANNNTSTRITYTQEFKCLFKLNSRTILNRCFPQDSISSINNALSSQYNITSSYSVAFTGAWFKTFTSDMYNLRGILFGIGLGVSTAVAFGYLYVLRLPGLLYLVIWTIILAVQICLIIGSFLLWSLATTWKNDGNHKSYEVNGMQILSFIGMGLSVLYFCLLLVLRKRVTLAIGIVKETARALASIPILIFLPVLQVIGVTIFLVPWVIYVIYLASSGEVQTHTKTFLSAAGTTVSYQYKTYTYEKNTRYAFLYMIFCYFWTTEFIVAIGQLILSLSIVSWYFTRDKSKIGNSTMFWAFRVSLLKHAGTAAFGSLIIAVVLTIRTILSYYERQAKKSKNCIMKYTLCVAQCCLWCLEKIMRFINKNAYIQTAIYGYSFLKAARTAFFLILRNILRVFAVNLVADFVLFLGKVRVAYLYFKIITID
jgi:hypothetical protein